VCASLEPRRRPRGERARRLRRLCIERRIVALCDAHADRVRAAGVETISDLRSLFPEKDGPRSLVGRRSVVDRRLFPPRPEGRRRAGRRGTDPAP